MVAPAGHGARALVLAALAAGIVGCGGPGSSTTTQGDASATTAVPGSTLDADVPALNAVLDEQRALDALYAAAARRGSGADQVLASRALRQGRDDALLLETRIHQRGGETDDPTPGEGAAPSVGTVGFRGTALRLERRGQAVGERAIRSVISPDVREDLTGLVTRSRARAASLRG